MVSLTQLVSHTDSSGICPVNKSILTPQVSATSPGVVFPDQDRKAGVLVVVGRSGIYFIFIFFLVIFLAEEKILLLLSLVQL